jgi:hypothetical protein
MRIALGYKTLSDPAARWVQIRNAWQAPRLPVLRAGAVRRWNAGPAWTPPDTLPLVRHRSLDGARCIVTTDRTSPPGFTVEFDLGLVQSNAQLGTARLIGSEGGFLLTRSEGELAEGYRSLGHVEQAPLPMLDALELRVDPLSESQVLVAGPSDPLYACATPIGTLGYVESYPINPRTATDRPVDWALSKLVRSVDDSRWRHVYRLADDATDELVTLGALWQRPGPGFVALLQDADGWLSSELLPQRRTRPSLGSLARWIAAPLGWTERRPRIWAARASAGRVQALARGRADTNLIGRPAASARLTLGYLKRTGGPGWVELYAASHPALADQYVTRSEIEATDMGYTIDGSLGYITDRFADRHRDALPAEVKWASRFGQGRRYIEGRRSRLS